MLSWYASWPPSACWDATGRHDVPRIRMFTAMRNVACGTPVTVSGPAGSVQVLVEDHGPWGLPGRDLDLSTDAFMAVIGSLSAGVGTASYVVGP